MLPVLTKVATAAWKFHEARASGRPLGGKWRWAIPAVTVALLAAGCMGLVVVTAMVGGEGEAEASEWGALVNVETIPPAALELLPEVDRILASSCPELPAPWLIAEVEVESSWNPLAYSSAGAAGLTQMMPASWAAATGDLGDWPNGGRPPESHPVWEPVTHLEFSIPWMCNNLRNISRHIAETDKPITALQAMAVCHLAGCSRVTGSVTGLPEPGEAGCGERCSAEVRAYVDRITALAEQYTAMPGVIDGSVEGLPPAPAPYTGGATDCVMEDPTSNGCLTGGAAHLFDQVAAAFGPWPAGCWDRHEWNPGSDHATGQACDYTVGRLGQFPGEDETAAGWQLAEWLRVNAVALDVKYVIYQGKIWQTLLAESGWTAYGGGGVYDPTDPTGGHYDHVHVSVTQ